MDIFVKVLAVGPLTFLSWPPDTSGEVYFVGSRGGNVCTMSPPFKVPTNFALYCVVGCLQRKVRWGKEVCGIDCGEESLARKGGWVVEEKKKKKVRKKTIENHWQVIWKVAILIKESKTSLKPPNNFFSKHLFIFSFYLGLFTKAGEAHKRGAMTILGKLNGVNMRALLMQPLQKIPEKLWLRQTNTLNTMMMMMMMITMIKESLI